MELRRKDRAITDLNAIKKIIEKCKVCRIAFYYDELIHIVPMNFGYDFDVDGRLVFYMHSALDGQKIKAIKEAGEKGLDVSVELDASYGITEGEHVCDYGLLYESIVGNGRAFILTDEDKKIYGLNRLMLHQTGREFDFTNEMMSAVSVIKINVSSYTCKGRTEAENISMPDKKNADDNSTECAYAYVDGSFNPADGIYGYGGFVVCGNEKYIVSGSGSDEEMASMRNVAGEVLGSMAAIKKAMELKIKRLKIYYDYNGIEKWATGEWKRNKKGTIAYYDFIQSVKDEIELEFEHVKGHSGIDGNEEADRLAKKASGIA